MEHVLRLIDAPYQVRDFAPSGYDQRQYCSPGFNLPIGGLSRTPHGQYAQYHTSADDLRCVTAEALGKSCQVVMQAIDVLQENRKFDNLFPKGEPRLGPRGLFAHAERLGLFWILNLSDGEHTLLDIADRARLPFATVWAGARMLSEQGLIRDVAERRTNGSGVHA